LVLTVGTQASASTWVFNVVRAIFTLYRPEALSDMAERGAYALRCLGRGAQDVVFKAHTVDQDLINLALLAEAKVIVTSRDPGDILVSQADRFGYDFKLAAAHLSHSLASIASLPPELDVLYLRYEDGFFDSISTVFDIANFIETPVSSAEAEAIAASLTSSAIASHIDDWMTINGVTDGSHWEADTHWHPGHLGDGKVGKWRDRLSNDQQNAMASALAPLDVGQRWSDHAIVWQPELFHFTPIEGTHDLEVDGRSRPLVHGPYFHLPAGLWRMTPLLEIVSGGPLCVKIDVFTLADGRGVLELKTVTLPTSHLGRLACEVDVVDHGHPLELRIESAADGQKGRLRFLGVRLEQVGESDGRAPPQAKSVAKTIKHGSTRSMEEGAFTRSQRN